MSTSTSAPALKPFTIGSRFSARASFDTGVKTLATGSTTAAGPQQVPAVGFLAGLLLKVSATASGGTPALTADAPFNLINQINFRNSKGDNLITPVSGYQLYLINKYGGQNPFGTGPFGDPKVGAGYVSTAASPSFYLWLPLSIDQASALGVVPATASNNNYQVEIIFSGLGTTWSGGATAGTASVQATAYYYDLPNEGGFEQTPRGLPTASVWNIETPPLTQGEKLVQSFNTGNIIRNHIIVVRNAAGARVDGDLPSITTLVLDNVDRLRLPKDQHEFLMARWYGLTNASKDAALGLDNGVIVFPYHLLSGGLNNDPANVRDQLLQTQTTSLVQFRGQSWGATAATMELITQSIATTDLNALYDKE